MVEMTLQLDAEIQRLLLEQVTGLEELEALLLLHRSGTKAMSVPQVAEAARLNPSSTAAALAHLQALGLLRAEGDASAPSYRYSPENAQLACVIDRLARLYAASPVEVIKQMSANAIERLRSSAARAFADAFVFKGKKNDR